MAQPESNPLTATPTSPSFEKTPRKQRKRHLKLRESSTTPNDQTPSEVFPAEINESRNPSEDSQLQGYVSQEDRGIYASATDSEGDDGNASFCAAESSSRDEDEDLAAHGEANSAASAQLQLHKRRTEATGTPLAIPSTMVEGSATNGTVLIPEPKLNSAGRFQCPFADTDDCAVTFSKKRNAVKHGGIHTANFECPVCNKRLARKGTLMNHMKLHTALGLATSKIDSKSTAQPKENQPAEKQPLYPAPAHVDDQNSWVQVSADSAKSEETAEPRDPAQQVEHEVESSVGAGYQSDAHRKIQSAEPEEVHSDVDVEVGSDLQDDDDSIPQDEDRDDMNGDGQTEGAMESLSERPFSSSPSIFDEIEKIKVMGTPMPGKLKRKRGTGDIPKTQQHSAEKFSKRRKMSPNSPPTSVQSRVDVTRSPSPQVPTVTRGSGLKQVTDKIIPKLQKRQGSINGWAQKYTPGSSLRHPAFNPKSPSQLAPIRIEVAIPGPSNVKSKGNTAVPVGSDVEMADGEPRPRQLGSFGRKVPRTTTYTTPKGKKRAEPGINYSTPSRDPTLHDNATSESTNSEPTNIATSVAKRTFGGQESRTRRREPEENSGSEFDVEEAVESEAEMPDAEKTAPSKTKTPRKNVVNGGSVECARCHQIFDNEKQLQRHLKKPAVHAGLFKCSDCNEEFWATSVLAKHERATGHGRGDGLKGRTGPFSEGEINELNNWRDTFCGIYDISRELFNDMMTATLSRKTKEKWIWGFMSKTEFLKEYLNVLPDRNKRSMMRYRERNFQNLAGSRNWTPEDDRELVRLQKELGTKWSEIAKRLMRTQDAVSQRWRHKLKYSDAGKGEWSKEELAKFAEVMEQVQQQLGAKTLEDSRIPWNMVSDKMGTRSAIQCSNHWRAVQCIKRNGRWVKTEGLEKTPVSGRIFTPSKMERRLRGDKVKKSPRRNLSNKFVRDEDEDENEDVEDEDEGRLSTGQEDDSDQENEQSEDQARTETTNDQENSSEAEIEASVKKTQQPSRNPLTDITPGKTLGSSQLFAQTQANTSALKASQRSRQGNASQDRPSPRIPIQRQRLRSQSPLRQTRAAMNGGVSDEDDVQEEDEVEDQDDGDKTQDPELVEATASESEGELSSEDSQADAGIAQGSEELGHGLQEKTEEDATDTSNDEYEESERLESFPEDEEEDAEDDESDSDGEPAHNNFMDSINESAMRMTSSQSQQARKAVLGKDWNRKHESNEDEETESE